MYRFNNTLVLVMIISTVFGSTAQARRGYTPQVKMARPPAASGKPSLENMRAAIYSAVRGGLPAYAGTTSHLVFDQRQEVILDRYAGPPVPEMRVEGVVYFQSAYESGRRATYRSRVRWQGHPDKWRVLYLEIDNSIPVRDELHPRPLNPVLTELQGSVHDLDGLRDELRQRLELEVSFEEWRPRGLAHEHEREELLHKLEGEQASERDLAPLRREVSDLQAQLVKAEDDRLAVRRRRQWLQGELTRRQNRLLAFLHGNCGRPQARAALRSDWLREQGIRWTRRKPTSTSRVSSALGTAPEASASAVDPQSRAGQEVVTAVQAQTAAREAEDQWYPKLLQAIRDLDHSATPEPKR